MVDEHYFWFPTRRGHKPLCAEIYSFHREKKLCFVYGHAEASPHTKTNGETMVILVHGWRVNDF